MQHLLNRVSSICLTDTRPKMHLYYAFNLRLSNCLFTAWDTLPTFNHTNSCLVSDVVENTNSTLTCQEFNVHQELDCLTGLKWIFDRRILLANVVCEVPCSSFQLFCKYSKRYFALFCSGFG